MFKFYSQVIALLFFSLIGFSQLNDTLIYADFEKGDTLQNLQPLTIEQLNEYVLSQQYIENEELIGGQISSIFHEVVSDAIISIKIQGQHTDSVKTKNGLFVLHNRSADKEGLLNIKITHPDYYSIDSSFLYYQSGPIVLSFELTPKHKILLRGRVFAGNLPIAEANIEIIHADKTYSLKTLGCFSDDEGYWNCLFNGMFKQELIGGDPSDSIDLFITSKGMKPLHTGMIFSEYSGELMHIKVKYASKLSEIPSNNFHLKLGFPFATSDHDWFVDISYYRLFNKTNLKRFAWGVDGNMYVSSVSVSYPTLSGLDLAKVDSSYITGFLGPSLLFWILSPDRRRFSTYAGCTFAIQFNNPQLVFQPFIGTRYFMDMNKALSLEFRYSEYTRDITHYEFNPYGNAVSYIKSEHFIKFHVNLGIQVVF